MRSIVTDQLAWSVWLLVGLSVTNSREPCKNGWTDQDTVWIVGSGGPRNRVLDGGSERPKRMGNYFEGTWVAHCKVQGCSVVTPENSRNDPDVVRVVDSSGPKPCITCVQMPMGKDNFWLSLIVWQYHSEQCYRYLVVLYSRCIWLYVMLYLFNVLFSLNS